MSERLQEIPTEETPPLDPGAVDRAYRHHRARRRARVERKRAAKRAGRRYWVALVLLLVAVIVAAVLVWREIERLFGL